MSENQQPKLKSMTVRVEEAVYTQFKTKLLSDRSNVQDFLAQAILRYIDGEKD